MTRPISAVVFDLGAVLIDWDARHLYRSLLADDAEIEAFFDAVGFAEWNEALDAGEDWDASVARLTARHPEHAPLIEAFRDRWPETLGEPIAPVVDVLHELVGSGMRTFALSNWSRRTFDIARPRFPFLGWFEGIVLSGDEGVTKPDPRIYRSLLERYRLDPTTTVFVDDRRRNVEVAERLGMIGVEVVDPATLRGTLRGLGVPLRPESG